MGLYTDHLLPRMVDRFLGKPEFDELRARVAGRLSGTVLEVGFGSGLNLPHLPPTVDRLLAIDPARVGRKLARERLARTRVPVEFQPLEGSTYPGIADASVDCVFTTWTLCTIPDLPAALSEMRRVLAPGGRLVFLEHGLASAPRLARWQRRVTPFHRLWAGGCRLDVPIDQRVREAGFEIDGLETYAFDPMGRLAGWLYEGRARPV